MSDHDLSLLEEFAAARGLQTRSLLNNVHGIGDYGCFICNCPDEDEQHELWLVIQLKYKQPRGSGKDKPAASITTAIQQGFRLVDIAVRTSYRLADTYDFWDDDTEEIKVVLAFDPKDAAQVKLALRLSGSAAQLRASLKAVAKSQQAPR